MAPSGECTNPAELRGMQEWNFDDESFRFLRTSDNRQAHKASYMLPIFPSFFGNHAAPDQFVVYTPRGRAATNRAVAQI